MNKGSWIRTWCYVFRTLRPVFWRSVAGATAESDGKIFVSGSVELSCDWVMWQRPGGRRLPPRSNLSVLSRQLQLEVSNAPLMGRSRFIYSPLYEQCGPCCQAFIYNDGCCCSFWTFSAYNGISCFCHI